MDRNVSIAPLNNPPSIRLSLPRLSLRHPRDLTAGEEESRWSVLRRLAARSLTRENSSIRDNASGSAAIPPASQQTQAIATIRTTRGVEQTTSRNRALSPIIDNARRHLERSSHIPEGAVSEDYDNEESNSGESILEESPMDSALEDDDYYSEEEKEEKEGDVEDDVYEHDNDMGLYERIWQGRRSAADLSYRRNEVLLSTSSCSTQHILDHQNLAGSEEAKLISDIPNTVLFAVCPVTGDHFEFSTLRTVFLA